MGWRAGGARGWRGWLLPVFFVLEWFGVGLCVRFAFVLCAHDVLLCYSCVVLCCVVVVLLCICWW